MDWEFTTIKTVNGVFETTGHGVSAVGDEIGPFEYVVLAEKEKLPVIIGIFGYGHTEEQARADADKKIANYENPPDFSATNIINRTLLMGKNENV